MSTTLPDEHALQATVTVLEEHGFSVEIVGDLDAAPGGTWPHPGGLVGSSTGAQDIRTSLSASRDRCARRCGRHGEW